MLWSKNALKFGTFTNEEVEIFVDKYFQDKFKIVKYINTNEHVEKKKTNLSIPIFETTNECTKRLSLLDEKDIDSNLHEITFQIFKKLVDMRLSLKISFD